MSEIVNVILLLWVALGLFYVLDIYFLKKIIKTESKLYSIYFTVFFFNLGLTGVCIVFAILVIFVMGFGWIIY